VLTSVGAPVAEDLLARLWGAAFPSPELLQTAASLIPSVREPAGPLTEQKEGPRWELIIAPGAIQIRTKDHARGSRAAERATHRETKDADWLAKAIADTGELPDVPPSLREITSWSAKSRANMTKTLCQLDYTPLLADPTRVPAMLTLTYPGDWLTVAPNGNATKKHLKALRKRYRRAWREDLICVWKLEFQGRGAPHFHLLMVPPHGQSRDGLTFWAWISLNWAEVVDHPDPEQFARHLRAGTGLDYREGLRSKDPKRIAVYFTKHGSFRAKEYQNCVPEPWREPGQGPGRFWGYWGLQPARVGVLVLPQVGIAAGRILRRWASAQCATHEVIRTRVNQSTGRVHVHTRRKRVRRMPNNRGWVSVNDGAAFASQLARALWAGGLEHPAPSGTTPGENPSHLPRYA
jgi:hypothetical protein